MLLYGVHKTHKIHWGKEIEHQYQDWHICSLSFVLVLQSLDNPDWEYMKTVATARPRFRSCVSVIAEGRDPECCMGYSVAVLGEHWCWFAVWVGILRSVLTKIVFENRRHLWSMHQILLASEEILIKVFSVEEDDQRNSVLYRSHCPFHYM